MMQRANSAPSTRVRGTGPDSEIKKTVQTDLTLYIRGIQSKFTEVQFVNISSSEGPKHPNVCIIFQYLTADEWVRLFKSVVLCPIVAP